MPYNETPDNGHRTRVRKVFICHVWQHGALEIVSVIWGAMECRLNFDDQAASILIVRISDQLIGLLQVCHVESMRALIPHQSPLGGPTDNGQMPVSPNHVSTLVTRRARDPHSNGRLREHSIGLCGHQNVRFWRVGCRCGCASTRSGRRADN